MTTPESHIQARILLECGALPDVRLFRNHVGRVVDVRGRRHTFGLCPGSPDIVGWRTVDGRAVFVGIEVKGPQTRIQENQTRFLAVLAAAGGLCGIARSVEDARRVLGC